MSTAVLEVTEATVNNFDEQESGKNPRTARWGFNPALRGVHIPPTRTGLPESNIPAGVFIPHRTFQTPQENCTIDEYKEREFLATVTAQESEDAVREALEKMGYQSLLYGVTDVSTVKVINKTVLPALSEIRELFAENSPVKFKCDGEDELDYGEPREACASCHLDWLRSAACTAYLDQIADDGMTVRVRTDSGTRKVTVKPNRAQLEDVRETVQKGLETYIKEASKQWAQTVSEIDNKKRDKLTDEEHFLRKDLHRLKPDQKELGMVREFAQSVAGNREAPQADNSEVITLMREQLEEQRKFNQIVAGKLFGEETKESKKGAKNQ
jgi:hypothetical protein